MIKFTVIGVIQGGKGYLTHDVRINDEVSTIFNDIISGHDVYLINADGPITIKLVNLTDK